MIVLLLLGCNTIGERSNTMEETRLVAFQVTILRFVVQFRGAGFINKLAYNNRKSLTFDSTGCGKKFVGTGKIK